MSNAFFRGGENVLGGLHPPGYGLYFGSYYSFDFTRLLFFLRFLECFPVISGFSMNIQHIRIHNQAVTRGSEAPLENFSPPWKNVLDIV